MENNFSKTLLTALMALVFGFLGAATWSYTGLADNRTRAFLMEEPAILKDMAEALNRQEAAEQIADLGDDFYEAFPGAVMGNPNGSKVLVEFTDYNCGYCAQSLPDVQKLIAEDPELKVILREMPIFEGSEPAARMALAAAKQGKYREFHEAMFRNGPTSPENIIKTAQEVGLDMERAQADAMSDEVTVEIASTMQYARSLGFTGTPAFIAEGTPFGGAVGYDALKDALNK